ncbi:MAG: hypothetical protein H7Z16_06410 [Pyrinomonadaceae bacterium]|nr:hypothetical protein [Pyrinomonadaceae bacterium]
MKYLKTLLMALAVLGMATWSTSINAQTSPPVMQPATQDQTTALERGYRTGYSDGYNAGYRDVADRAARDYQNKDEYKRGDRTYNEAWGTAEDYRDGYQQGFELGYAAGYDRGPFNSTIPTGLTRRGSVDSGQTGNATPTSNYPESTTDNSTGNTNVLTRSSPVFIPRDSILVVELQSSLSTEATQLGDRFQARVVEPSEFAGAILEGRVTRVKKPGKVKGTAELQLSFESIRTVDNRTASIHADVVGIVEMDNSREGAGTVDSEGGVKGRNSTKDDVSKVGAATGIGAVLGAIFGGGKGAAIGAAVGGSVGTAGVLTQRGKDVRLERGQRLKIRTATDARFQ